MPTLREVKTVSPVGNVNANTTPPVIATPDIVAGSLIVVFAWWAQGLGGGSSAIYTPNHMTKASGDGTSTNRAGAVFYAVVDNPADFVGGITLRCAVTATRVSAVAVSYSPDSGKVFNPATVQSGGPAWASGTLSSGTFPGGVTGDLILDAMMSNKGASTTITTSTATGGTLLGQATSLSAASGSVSDSNVAVTRGSTGISWNISQANRQSYSFAISQSDAPSTSRQILVANGSGVPEPHALYISNGSTIDPVARLAVMPEPYTVSQFHSDAGSDKYPRMAHRNVGASLPECTVRGSLWAALRHGCRTIEFSAHRSSDGVWVGSHDATLDRATTGTGAIVSQTWTSMSSVVVDVGPNQTSPPATLSRLSDFLDAFKDYVMVVDNKTGANRTEFIALLKTVPNWEEHIIIKIDGSHPASMFQEYSDAGFKVLAYWYDVSNWSTIPGKMPWTDYPGLNVSPVLSNTSYWTDMKAIMASQTAIDSKERYLWAHVLDDPSEVAVSIAPDRGAKILQCTTANLFPAYDW